MGALIRSMNWAKTPLGPIESWSPSLRMMIRFLLANRFPLLLWWGPRYVSIYNDPYCPVLGTKHPWALGLPVSECWSEIWHILQPLIDTPFNGGPATWNDDIFLEINRYGFVEETHFTIAYSPVPDDTVPGGIGGVLATVHEITEKVVSERRVVALRDLGARVGDAKTAEEACAIAAQTLAGHARDVPFVLLYLLDSESTQAHLAGAAGVAMGEDISPAEIDLSESEGAAWPFAEVKARGSMQLVTSLGERFAAVPPGPWSGPPDTAVVVPIPSNISQVVAGFMVAGLSARLKFDEYYLDFLELVRTQVATAVANARAYESERRRAEALAELDRAKTAFFSNVSHEFRTPLTLLLGPLEDILAGQKGPLPPESREELDVAHRNALRLLRLVNTLLDFSRIEAGRAQASYEPTDLAALTADLASVFRSAIERAGLRLLVDCPPPPKGTEVYVDRDMWEKVVLNLVSNAFKHTFEGEIAVSLRPGADGTALELAVRDTGTGIPEDELPRLFERFHRVQGARARTYEGTGIGLALVQELVKQHGGTIAVESRVDAGTAFTVSIPTGKAHLPTERIGAARSLASTATGAAPFVEEALRWLPTGDEAPLGVDVGERSAGKEALFGLVRADDARAPGARSARVLLADDNADLRAYMTRLLRGRYDVEAVADGGAALEAARARPPDLVLADVMMPGLDGFALLRSLREDPSFRELPVILLSARAGEESRVEGLEAGADDYLVKPFSARELLARVGSHIELARLRTEAAQRERAARDEVELERARLLESEERLRLALEAGAMGTWDWDPASGRIVWSKDTERLYGLEPAAFDGTYETYMGLIHAEDRADLAATIDRAAEHGEDFAVEHRAIWPDGTVRWLAGRGRAYLDAAGHLLRMAGTVIDVTERRQAEEERERLEREKDAFLATASHDLKNPLASIKGNAQLIGRQVARGVVDPARLTAGLASIDSAASQMVALIDALLDLTRLRLGQPLDLERALTDLVALARRVAAEQQATTERHRIVVEAAEAELVGAWDARRLERVLGNLLSNAVKYSPRGGRIVVAVAREDDADGAWALLAVRDRGLGILAQDRPHIFEHFYRAANVASAIAGTGIGLAGARQIVEQHGGSITVESRDGEGSTFTVRLPLAPDLPGGVPAGD